MSQRIWLVFAALLVAGLLAVPGALGRAGHSTAAPELVVTFQADKSVTVVDGSGSPVGTSAGQPTVIPPGTYNVLISDPSFVSDVLWDLAGPGVKLTTSMSSGEEISEAWVEDFAPSSTYTYRDDNRPPGFSTFVTSATGATTTTGPASPSPTSTTPQKSGTTGKTNSTDPIGELATKARGSLVATVSAAGKAKLTFKGKAVSSLKSGSYTFKVTDRSAKAGFTLQGHKKAAHTVTAAKFRGKKSVKIVLTAGQWFFFPTFVGKKTFFYVVS